MEEVIKMHLPLLKLPQPGSNWFLLGKFFLNIQSLLQRPLLAKDCFIFVLSNKVTVFHTLLFCYFKKTVECLNSTRFFLVFHVLQHGIGS